MIRIAFAGRGLPHLTRAQTIAHLRDIHGPMVFDTPTMRTRSKTYIQNYALDEPVIPGTTTRFDFVNESWRDETVVLPEPPVAPDHIRLREDEGRFPDRENLLIVQLQEDCVWAADRGEPFAAAPIKVWTYIKRRPGLSDEAFVQAWHAAGHVLAGNPAFQAHARRLNQNLCVPGEGERTHHTQSPRASKTPPVDGVDVMRFRSAEDVAALFDNAEFLAALKVYESACADPDALFRFVTTEKVVFDDAGAEAAARA